ncbi:MAG: HPF/RaiA family ribosome-associated protein [Nitrospirae bacterium]|nr:HPF/RaiA family ribosome-associated protein [Nitrospirota bacterium]
MNMPLQLTVRNMSLSEAAEMDIREKAAGLDSLYDKITGCRVVVEAPHRHHHKGILYEVRIDITVPGKELVITQKANEDVYVAIRDAFDAARRNLEQFARRQRGIVKTHENLTLPGRITQLFSLKGYGFLDSEDGRTFYFHRNSLLNAEFDRLKIGEEVQFVEESGEKGPQASFVEVSEKQSQ